MSIDFGKIVTNALSTLVAAVFVGAAAIVWHAATSVDERINEANKDIIKQQSALKATQETIVPELTNMKSIIEELRAEIRSLNKLLSDTKALPERTEYKEGEPVILKEFTKNI
jgi:septal ring factor EnvC (AmiA/AmiB activator)